MPIGITAPMNIDLQHEPEAENTGDCMKVAIPTEQGVLCPHFGHCSTFTIIEVDPETLKLTNVQTLTPPPHERGVIPAWLNELGCTHIIAGGMGQRAVMLFQQNGVEVFSGVPEMKAEDAVRALIGGELQTGANPCHDPGFRRQGHGEGQCHSGDHQHE